MSSDGKEDGRSGLTAPNSEARQLIQQHRGGGGGSACCLPEEPKMGNQSRSSSLETKPVEADGDLGLGEAAVFEEGEDEAGAGAASTDSDGEQRRRRRAEEGRRRRRALRLGGRNGRGEGVARLYGLLELNRSRMGKEEERRGAMAATRAANLETLDGGGGEEVDVVEAGGGLGGDELGEEGGELGEEGGELGEDGEELRLRAMEGGRIAEEKQGGGGQN